MSVDKSLGNIKFIDPAVKRKVTIKEEDEEKKERDERCSNNEGKKR